MCPKQIKEEKEKLKMNEHELKSKISILIKEN